MAKPTSRTIVRAWNREGYHKDLAVLDSQQIRMSHQGMEPGTYQILAADFPEMEKFEIIVEEYR